MNVLLVYYTGTFNTRYLSNCLKTQFEQEGDTVTLHEIDPSKKYSISYEGYDLVGFGHPIYGFAAPYPFLQFIRRQKMPKGLRCFIYKNSGETFHDNDASGKHVLRALRHKGVRPFSEYHFPMPYNIHFRYEEKLVKEILVMNDKQVRILVHEVRNGIERPIRYSLFAGCVFSLVAPFQYIAGDVNTWFMRVHKDKCSNCNLCIKSCPMHNIYRDKNDQIRFGHHCLMCQRCSLRCPKDAIWIGFLDSWGWRVNGAYNFKKTAELPYEPVITDQTTGFFECFIEKFDEINRRYDELFGDGTIANAPRKPHRKTKSMFYRLMRLLFCRIDVQDE